MLAPHARDAEDDAWKAAMSLKQKSANLEAAAAFAKFKVDFPQSSHVIAGSVEEGVCWFSSGRSAQVLQHTTPQAQERFDKALALFKSVTSEHPSAPEAPRACYMQGSTHLFLGDLETAERDYTTVLEKFSADRNYFGKALEQRARVRRHLLRTEPAISDMQRWLKEVGNPPEQVSRVKSQLARAQMLEKPAPAYRAETWFSGDPMPLESQLGAVVAICFFATWCPNCEAELPYLLDLEQRFTARGVRFVGVVNQGKGQTPDVVRQFLVKERIPFTVFQDNGAAGTTYKVDTIPMLALIDRFGNLRWCDNPSTLAESTIERIMNEGLEPAKKSDAK